MTEILRDVDPVLHVLAAAGYLITFVLQVLYFRFGLKVERFAVWVGVVSFVLHLAAIIARWVVLGHVPAVTRYDNLSWYAFATTAIASYLMIRKSSLRQVGLILYPSAFAVLVWALYSGPRVEHLPPAFSGIWFLMHIAFYYMSFGAAVAAVGGSLLYVVGPRLKALAARGLTDLDEIDKFAYKYAGLAFAFWGFGMLTGAVWAFSAWGRYWAWDPIETWSLVTWLLMGLYLHLRRFYAWRGAKAAWLYLLSFMFVLFSLFGSTIFLDTLHAVYFR